MIDNPWKIVLNSPDGRQFIRYKTKTVSFFIEVFEIEGAEIFEHRFRQFKEHFNDNDMDFVGASLVHNQKHYLLVVIDYEYIKEVTSPPSANKLAHRIRKLADWYRYTYLLPKDKQTLNPQAL